MDLKVELLDGCFSFSGRSNKIFVGKYMTRLISLAIISAPISCKGRVVIKKSYSHICSLKFSEIFSDVRPNLVFDQWISETYIKQLNVYVDHFILCDKDMKVISSCNTLSSLRYTFMILIIVHFFCVSGQYIFTTLTVHKVNNYYKSPKAWLMLAAYVNCLT